MPSFPPLRVAEAAAALVFGAARVRGPIARDVIAQTTGLSIATVNRQVTALLGEAVALRRDMLNPDDLVVGVWPSPSIRRGWVRRAVRDRAA